MDNIIIRPRNSQNRDINLINVHRDNFFGIITSDLTDTMESIKI